MTLDKNKTVWQRVNDVLREQGYSGRELDELTATLHKHILAERDDARSAVFLTSTIQIDPGSVEVMLR